MLPLLLTAALLLPLDAAEDAKKELEKIQGTWVATAVEFGGGGEDRAGVDHRPIPVATRAEE